jgi:hypothetical protein
LIRSRVRYRHPADDEKVVHLRRCLGHLRTWCSSSPQASTPSSAITTSRGRFLGGGIFVHQTVITRQGMETPNPSTPPASSTRAGCVKYLKHAVGILAASVSRTRLAWSRRKLGQLIGSLFRLAPHACQRDVRDGRAWLARSVS